MMNFPKENMKEVNFNNNPDAVLIPDVFFPNPCCGHCTRNLGGRCMKEWNNADEDYYIPWRDDKEPDDCCEVYEWDGEILEEPRSPERGDYRTEAAYKQACAWVRLWHERQRKEGLE